MKEQPLDSLWDFADPAGSEARFRERLAGASRQQRAGILTQIARAQGLQRRFEAAEETLRTAESIGSREPAVCARISLERGRLLRTSGDVSGAKPHFGAAWIVSRKAGLDGLAVDAAHMIALVESGDAALAWSNRALDLARGSSQPEAHRWVASLLNNIGWAHHEAGRYGEALGAFRSAQDERERRGDAREVRIARWCVARALRSLGKLEDALREQMALAVDHAEAGTRDGYVHEELAECLQALGRPEEARAHFAAAFELLGSDAGLCASDPVRVHRLGVLAGLSSDRPSGAAAPGQPI